MINQKCEVVVAAIGAQKAVLQGEFPSLTFIELRGYNVIYDKNRAFTVLRLMGAIPKILIRIKQERAWLRQFMESGKPDLVISDNRYGLALPGVFCIFMTHQLRIRTSFGRFADALLQRMNYRLIGHFSRCWVPDIETGEGFAGALSHPARRPVIPTKYIGLLSRFGNFSRRHVEAGMPGGAELLNAAEPSKDPELLIVLSGPEPQRTLLERRIMAQVGSNPSRVVLVRGLPDGAVALAGIPQGMKVYDHLPAAALEPLIIRAGLVIARSGYSTVMDLARLGKRALLIPTPGQPEQEYLGSFLALKGRAICVRQSAFSLQEALVLARQGVAGDLAKAAAGDRSIAAAGDLLPEPEDKLLETEIRAVLAMLDPGGRN